MDHKRNGSQGLIARVARIGAGAFAAAALALSPASAQNVETFDPDQVYQDDSANAGSQGGIDADLSNPDLRAPPVAQPLPQQSVQNTPSQDTGQTGFEDEFSQYEAQTQGGPAPDYAETLPENATANDVEATSATYGEDDLIGAAEGVFGKGAQGLAGLIEDLLREQGEPNGYIVGREAGGAFIVGARYGSGTLYHKVEGERPVYWTGPSVGVDAGANAANTFVLVYNLFDTEDLYRRYPAGEGQAYFVGGLNVSYVRRGDVVLIPIRMGAGLRLGVNAGYMRFSKKQRWLPF